MTYSTKLFRPLVVLALGSLCIAYPHSVLEETSTNSDTNGDTNGEKCGVQNGGAICSSGWCCGPDGVCGKGVFHCSAPACQFQFADACQANSNPFGPNTINTPRPALGSVPYGATIYHCKTPGKIAMTFDDGPSNFTVGLLDFLKSLDVHATFFLTPASGGKEHIEVPTSHYFNIVKRMIDDGHQIGSHTWSHQDLDAISREDRLEQMHKTETALSSILGFFPTYMRAPYLNCGPDCQDDMDAVTGLGYHVVNIDLDTYDWKRNYDDAKRNFRDGNGQFPGLSQSPHGSGSFITLSHDIFEETVEDLVPFMMKIVKEYGYTPVTVGECLEDPPENWYRDPVTGKAAGPSRS